MAQVVEIRLRKDELIITLNEKCEYKEIQKALKKKIPELKKLYKEDKTPIFVTGKVLKNKEIEEIKNIIKSEINVEIEFDSPKVLGLYGIKKAYNQDIGASTTIYHKGSIRSGQKIENEGSIVIIPPFGNQKLIWTIIGTLATITLAGGIYLIKKKVL